MIFLGDSQLKKWYVVSFIHEFEDKVSPEASKQFVRYLHTLHICTFPFRYLSCKLCGWFGITISHDSPGL